MVEVAKVTVVVEAVEVAMVVAEVAVVAARRTGESEGGGEV